MRTLRHVLAVSVASACLCLVTGARGQTPLGTSFTYQGRLDGAGGAYTGSADFRFTLFNAATDGSQVGSPVTLTNTTVLAGLFDATLDFGNNFSGQERWLLIEVRTPSGSGTFRALTPRQRVSPTPYSLYSRRAGVADDLFTVLGTGGKVRFGTTTSQCDVGLDPSLSGINVRDVGGARIRNPVTPGDVRLRLGETDNCAIQISPTLPGLLLHDPNGIRVRNPLAPGDSRLLFGDTANCTISISPTLTGLIASDPSGLRVRNPLVAGEGRVLFTDAATCMIDVTPTRPGLTAHDVNGFRIRNPVTPTSAILRFGDTSVCFFDINASRPGLNASDPTGLRVRNPLVAGEGRLLFTDAANCMIDVTPARLGLTAHDVNGFRVRNPVVPTDAVLRFGDSNDCAILITPARPGLNMHDPNGVRLINPLGGIITLNFGQTNNCQITAGDVLTPGLVFHDPNAFRFQGGPIGVNLPFPPEMGLQLPPVPGPVGTVMAQTFATYSSSKYKDEIRGLQDALGTVSRLRGVTYQWKSSDSAHRELGFIAEEVAAVLPEVVTFRQNEAAGIAYDRVAALTVEAIKQQQSQIDRLASENAKLRAELDEIKALLRQGAPAR